MVLSYLIQSFQSKVLQFLQQLISWHYHRLTSFRKLTGIHRGPLRHSYPGLYDSTPVDKWQVAAAIVAPIRAPGVPEEETVAIIALNRNCMKIMGQVIVALPEGRAAIV